MDTDNTDRKKHICFLIHANPCESVAKFLPTPLQFIPQHIKIIPVRRLDEIKRGLALADSDSIAAIERNTGLAVERKEHTLVVADQLELDLGTVGDNDRTICQRKGADRG